MRSRRDQVQAHLFVVRRLRTGMLRDDPEDPDPPVNRTTRGVVIGLVVAFLVALGVGVYGFIVPGGATGWRQPGTLVVVRGTGSRMLYLDGELRPVLNQSSARLLAGKELVVDVVDERSLEGVPRGAPIGVVGAPDALPAPSTVDGAEWLVCGTVTTGPGGKAAARTSLGVAVGHRGRGLAEGEGAVVSAPDGSVSLLWHGQRLRLDTAHGAVSALGYDAVTPFPVSAAVLDALPAGPDLAPPPVPGAGRDGPVLAGRPTRVGQLFTGPGGEPYLLRADGLLALTELQRDLVRGDPRTQQAGYAGGPVVPGPVGPDDLAAHRAPAEASAARDGLPTTAPRPVPIGSRQGVCAEVRPRGDSPVTAVTVVGDGEVRGAEPTAEPGVRPACVPVDEVVVRPGGGALVRALPAAGGPGGTAFLVTDTGRKYPVPDDRSAAQLGYALSSAVGLPAALTAALPTGPALDAALLAARGVVPPGPGGACG
ncbi:type VII secretion protein EccB [Actinosynnema sp. NPDC053489]|uniref:type VII secretion protein EccB n=1 Tax=Actinosynnema sp. NPDC053489 TaxID=3363916 RepID=UPI0037CC9F24